MELIICCAALHNAKKPHEAACGPCSFCTTCLLKEGKNHCVDQKIIQTQIFTAMEVK
jgi:hypothetical protein